MAFNQQVVKCYAQGAQTAYIAPLNAFKGSQIALNGVTTGNTTSTAGLVINCSGPQYNIEWESLVALVETDITTSALVVKSKWQGSMDGTNWVDLVNLNGVAALQIAAAGTGSLVTKQYFHPLAGLQPGMDFLRLAVISTAATGAAGDNVTVSYCFRRRWSNAA